MVVTECGTALSMVGCQLVINCRRGQLCHVQYRFWHSQIYLYINEWSVTGEIKATFKNEWICCATALGGRLCVPMF